MQGSTEVDVDLLPRSRVHGNIAPEHPVMGLTARIDMSIPTDFSTIQAYEGLCCLPINSTQVVPGKEINTWRERGLLPGVYKCIISSFYLCSQGAQNR